MIIDSMFVYLFVDPDLRLETFFDEAAEKKMKQQKMGALILKQGI